MRVHVDLNHHCNRRKVELIPARFLTQQQKRNLQFPLKCYIKFDEKTAWCRSFPLRAVYSLRKFHSCCRYPASGEVFAADSKMRLFGSGAKASDFRCVIRALNSNIYRYRCEQLGCEVIYHDKLHFAQPPLLSCSEFMTIYTFSHHSCLFLSVVLCHTCHFDPPTSPTTP